MAAEKAMTRGHARMALILSVAVLCAGCPSAPPGGGGGVTIPQSDSSPPEITLGVAQGSQTATGKNGGQPSSLTLTAKTGSLNLLATGVDNESGLRDVQIWINKTTTTCDAGGTCSTAGPGLLGSPSYSAPGPTKSPGQTAAASSILAQAFDLTVQIPQGPPAAGGSRNIGLEFWAVAINNLGGQSQTAKITATWKEP